MKKIISLVLVMAMTVAIAGCASNDEQMVSFESSSISESVSQANNEKTYIYNGSEYKAEELSQDTIKWLQMDMSERALSSYFPTEFSVCIVTKIDSGISYALSDEDTDFIAKITDEGVWREGITECFMDYKITLNGKNLMYHSDCGTFNSSDPSFGAKKDKAALTLSQSLKEELNIILSKYTDK